MTQAPGWPGLGDEELLIAVANTAHGDQDELTDAGTVIAWWSRLGAPVAARRRGTASDESVAVLRTMRGLIRGLALRNNGIEPAPAEFADLEALPLRLDLRGAPTLRADPSGDLARDICAAASAALLRATARPGWPRIKACRGDDCRWVFLDRSRNSSRRWCDMTNCGNRAKIAAFRDRRRATGTG
jgi:predicted RNA-binding Zn ribbon-like protein